MIWKEDDKYLQNVVFSALSFVLAPLPCFYSAVPALLPLLHNGTQVIFFWKTFETSKYHRVAKKSGNIFLAYWKYFFVRYSSEYETSDNSQTPNGT